MNDSERGSAIDVVKALANAARDGETSLAIGKTAFKDGLRGLGVRGLSLIQRWNEERFGAAFLDELEQMRRAGAIREDFDQTDAGAASFQELLEMLGNKPNEERFEAFCALFMSANAPNADPNTAIVDIELMHALQGLTIGEMHLLSGFLKIRVFGSGTTDKKAEVAKQLGYHFPALIDKNIKALIEAGLISGGAMTPSSSRVLTDLGQRLLEKTEAFRALKRRSTGG